MDSSFYLQEATARDQMHPAAAAAATHTSACSTGGSFSVIPSTQAAREPTTNCPSAPMLKTPVRKENATLKPVKIRGLA